MLERLGRAEARLGELRVEMERGVAGLRDQLRLIHAALRAVRLPAAANPPLCP